MDPKQFRICSYAMAQGSNWEPNQYVEQFGFRWRILYRSRRRKTGTSCSTRRQCRSRTGWHEQPHDLHTDDKSACDFNRVYMGRSYFRGCFDRSSWGCWVR